MKIKSHLLRSFSAFFLVLIIPFSIIFEMNKKPAPVELFMGTNVIDVLFSIAKKYDENLIVFMLLPIVSLCISYKFTKREDWQNMWKSILALYLVFSVVVIVTLAICLTNYFNNPSVQKIANLYIIESTINHVDYSRTNFIDYFRTNFYMYTFVGFGIGLIIQLVARKIISNPKK